MLVLSLSKGDTIHYQNEVSHTEDFTSSDRYKTFHSHVTRSRIMLYKQGLQNCNAERKEVKSSKLSSSYEFFVAGLYELKTPPVPVRLLRVDDGSIVVLSERIVDQ
ncbi:hypothetical protein BDC45DRAFT_532379 [Circinella umbellata]|nr:hypothetical protein BDC45DRAFT_532379 [Circinella umbellata]